MRCCGFCADRSELKKNTSKRSPALAICVVTCFSVYFGAVHTPYPSLKTLAMLGVKTPIPPFESLRWPPCDLLNEQYTRHTKHGLSTPPSVTTHPVSNSPPPAPTAISYMAGTTTNKVSPLTPAFAVSKKRCVLR